MIMLCTSRSKNGSQFPPGDGSSFGHKIPYMIKTKPITSYCVKQSLHDWFKKEYKGIYYRNQIYNIDKKGIYPAREEDIILITIKDIYVYIYGCHKTVSPL